MEALWRESVALPFLFRAVQRSLQAASCDPERLTGINPGIMARFRSQALNIARANGVTNIAEALWIAAIDPSISLSYGGL